MKEPSAEKVLSKRFCTKKYAKSIVAIFRVQSVQNEEVTWSSSVAEAASSF